METGHARELEVLAEAECRALLAANQVGRVAVVVDGQPAICPVYYVVDGDSIVVRTNWPLLTRACPALVAFQIDGVDVGLQSGWSLMVQGMAHDLTDALDPASEHLQTVPVSPWAPGPEPRLLRLVPRTITGHRFH
jgi:nitroimidazol reductase NimA-like FMN-containing flavoprotein (pyridoxamine 5'-phosphate oxidase superfamily)